jgi:hypothetical protein
VWVVVLLIVVFAAAFAMYVTIIRRKATKVAAGANELQAFAARWGMRFGPARVNLPQRAPVINELVGDLVIYVDFQLDGTVNDTPFQAFQVRRPPPRHHAVTIDLSVWTPEFTAILVPRPDAGPELSIAPQTLSWWTALRRDLQVGRPEFDAAFSVSCSDADYARRVLTPVADWLVADPRTAGLVIAFQQSDLLALTNGPMTPDRAMDLARLTTELHRRLRAAL